MQIFRNCIARMCAVRCCGNSLFCFLFVLDALCFVLWAVDVLSPRLPLTQTNVRYISAASVIVYVPHSRIAQRFECLFCILIDKSRTTRGGTGTGGTVVVVDMDHHTQRTARRMRDSLCTPHTRVTLHRHSSGSFILVCSSSSSCAHKFRTPHFSRRTNFVFGSKPRRQANAINWHVFSAIAGLHRRSPRLLVLLILFIASF